MSVGSAARGLNVCSVAGTGVRFRTREPGLQGMVLVSTSYMS